MLENQLAQTGELRFVDITSRLGVRPSDLWREVAPLAWDFDGDGWVDVAGLGIAPAGPSYFNREGRRLSPTTQLEGLISRHRSRIHLVDINGDGYLDVVGFRGGERIQYVYQPASRSFIGSRRPYDPLIGLPPDLVAHVAALRQRPENRFLEVFVEYIDLDGDGRRDALVHGFGAYGGSVFCRALLADERGGWQPADDLGYPTSAVPIAIFRVDGRLTIVFGIGPECGWYVVGEGGRCERRRAEALERFLTPQPQYPYRAIVSDLTADARPDLVLVDPRGGRAEVFQNTSRGPVSVLSTHAWDGDAVTVADLDGDGLLDVAVGGGSDPLRGSHDSIDVTIYRNCSEPPQPPLRLSLRMPPPNRFAVGAIVRVRMVRRGTSAIDQPLPAQPLEGEGANDERPLRSEPSDASHADSPATIGTQSFRAALDGRPLLIGRGDADWLDVRVTFPDGAVVDAVVASEAAYTIRHPGVAED